MSKEEKAASSVVDSVKLPKIKIDNKKATAINAFATAFACFFGFSAVMSAISNFTDGKWGFNIPFLGAFLGSNLGPVDNSLVISLAALLCAVIGMATVRKVVSVDAMKQSWQKVAKVFAVVGAIFCVDLVAIALYSLLSIGRKDYGFSQGALWGSNFVSNLLLACASIAMCFISGKIAKGDAKYLSVMRFVALGIAIAGFAMIFISLIVNLHQSRGMTDWSDLDSYLPDYFKQ